MRDFKRWLGCLLIHLKQSFLYWCYETDERDARESLRIALTRYVLLAKNYYKEPYSGIERVNEVHIEHQGWRITATNNYTPECEKKTLDTGLGITHFKAVQKRKKERELEPKK